MNQEHINLEAIRQTCTIRDREGSVQREKELQAKTPYTHTHTQAKTPHTHTHTHAMYHKRPETVYTHTHTHHVP